MGRTATLREENYRRLGRIRSLSDTIDIALSLREIAGISRLADITDLDVLGIPVYNSYRPAAAKRNLTVSCGKGLTQEAAIASALMEAIERHFGEQRGRHFPKLSFTEVSRQFGNVLDPRRLNPDLRFPLDIEAPREWVESVEVNSGSHCWVPADVVFTPCEATGLRNFSQHSDGLVSGNSWEEALLHGMLELIERDARSFGELLRRGFKLEPNSLPLQVNSLLKRFDTEGIDVELFCFESPTGLPVIYAIGDDVDSRHPMLINGGAGAALNPLTACIRAVTELAQSRLSVISGSREDFSSRFGTRRASEYSAVKRVADLWRSGWRSDTFASISSSNTQSLSSDISVVLDRLASIGMNEVYVVQLSPEELQISVVKVIIPGIEFAVEEPYRIGSRFYRMALKEKSFQ